MSLSTSGRTWDDASSPAATRLVRRFETAWREASHRRPEPADFLPADLRQRPGALLALLRSEMTLRFEAGEPVRAEDYWSRYPDLAIDARVALVYEEFCLHEDADQDPDPAEYQTRFPDLASRLQRVLGIHDLIGSGPNESLMAPDPPEVPFPAAGETIAGFKLIEELGRGSFARVFRAEERQLADRPVALKVARAGSREPQTLARLQHTHIVPVHSYWIDPSGLHLLCMPYFGRVTLARVLADSAARGARTGAELVTALERLEPSEGVTSMRPAGRLALARRSYHQAIAWWGARLAEALQHAHERGVLHRDIKPSNVLVTGDGLPMLLDFNLAQGHPADDPNGATSAPGGTLAYMAPEHLEALAQGNADQVDGRADLYSLGVVLYETLGTRPFSVPTGSLSMSEALLRAAHERRAGPPSLREDYPDVPPALDAVVRRCLAPDPTDRYQSAAELAADLQAVADDGPLRFAREPQPHRTYRWCWRKRFWIAAAVVLGTTTFLYTESYLERREAHYQRTADIQGLMNKGDALVQSERFIEAEELYARANDLARSQPGFAKLALEADNWRQTAHETQRSRRKADRLFEQARELRFHLLGFGGPPETAFSQVAEVLKSYFVLSHSNWASSTQVAQLNPTRRFRLLEEVDDLMFRWAVALARRNELEMDLFALSLCDRAPGAAAASGPWRALRARLVARRDGTPPPREAPDDPEAESSPLACFQWGLLYSLAGRDDRAIAWLKRAIRIRPGDYWSQFYLAYIFDRAEKPERALEHYSVAIALAPERPWAYLNRGILYRARRLWREALADLNEASQGASGELALQVNLELGLIRQALGDSAGARAAYDEVIARGAGTDYARAARVNRARLDLEAGRVEHARSEYDALLTEDPNDTVARRGRALLALQESNPAQAEADLTELLQLAPGDAEAAALRALARLDLDRPQEAEADAEQAVRWWPCPAHERLRTRTRLAAGQLDDFRLCQPDDVLLWPAGGPALAADLRVAAERLRSLAEGAGPEATATRLTRAVILSMLGDPAALAEADRAVALSLPSVQTFLTRARIRLRAGDLHGALEDIDRGLALDPTAPRLLELRGRIELQKGQPALALADLDRALSRGAEATVRIPRAHALMALGRDREALHDWSLALEYDPHDPRAFLGRARAFCRLGEWDQARIDLDQAADRTSGGELLAAVALTTAVHLPERPDWLPRVLNLVRRAWSTPPAGPAPPPSRGPEPPALDGLAREG